MRYRFGAFCLDDTRYELTGPQGHVHVEPQVFDVLRHLLVHRDRVVPKEELLDEVWGSRFVSESALTSRLKAARRAIGDDGKAQRAIKTVHGRGYHFVATVEEESTTSDDAPRALPSRRTALVGREDDVAAIAQRVRQHRLVTITGPGGVGKTSVAVEVASRLASELRDGAVFVDLVPALTADDVTRGLAEAAGIQGDASRSMDRLVDHVAGRELLVVLDNCEHVIEPCALLADRLRSTGAQVRVLATSREALGLVGEQRWPLPALGPAATELFVQRAEEVEPRVAWRSDDPAVVRLCAQLDGLPLAVELAAGQLGRFDLLELTERLEGRLTLLARRAVGGHERHSAMDATIEWSYRLLDEDEQRLLRQLSVFPSSFDLDAVEGAAPPLRSPAAVVLGDLVSKSLVTRDPRTGRYRLLETIRAFAASVLHAEGEAATARERHRSHVVRRVTSERRLDRWMSAELAARYRSNLDDARQAFQSSLRGGHAVDALEIACGASFLWRNAMGCTEGVGWVDALARAELSPRDARWMHVLRADVGQGIGDHRMLFEAAVAARSVDAAMDDRVARCLAAHFDSLAVVTDPTAAAASLEAAVLLAEQSGDVRLVTLADAFRAVAELANRCIDDARRRIERLDRVGSPDGYDRFIVNWVGWMVGLAERDRTSARRWMSKQQDLLDHSGIRETWITVFSGLVTDMLAGGDLSAPLRRAHALAEREGYRADGDCTLALAYAAICEDRFVDGAELVGTARRARFNATAHYVLYRTVVDPALRSHLDPATLEAAVARGASRAAADVLRAHGIDPR